MKTDWNFYDWMHGDVEGKNYYRYIIFIIVFFLIPGLLYFVVKWDPIMGLNEDGEPNQMVGMFVIVGLYWGVAYFLYKRDETKNKLNCLLDKLLSKDDEEFKEFIEIAKRRRKDIKENKLELETGEGRLQWFNIR